MTQSPPRSPKKILGVFHSHVDPSAALCVGDEVVAFIEEERLMRNKHATGRFPIRAIEYVLKRGGLSISDLDYIAQAWDCAKYDNGSITRHFEEVNKQYPTDDGDLAYQRRALGQFRSQAQRETILRNLRKHFGDVRFPEIKFVNHHLAHACQAFFLSGIAESLVVTLDGSGEEVTTAWWIGRGRKLELLREIKVPHSLGWFYSAFTEYLGFEAYDGEYKVMGLAAYGKRDATLERKMEEILWYDGEGGFKTNPMLLSRGARKYSYYFPDQLAEFMGRPPRAEKQDIEDWHKDCAWAAQHQLERVVREMLAYWIGKTGLRKLCISGGVGLNVKMNGNLFADGCVDDISIFPLCSDAGQPIGAAMALRYGLEGGLENRPLQDLYLGTEFSDVEVETILKNCKVEYRRESAIEKTAAKLISEGKVVGWFQGRMEGGPRALGARSILADPREVAARDKVNAVIKYREPWRPFCPSMTMEGARMYFEKQTRAPFMILTFRANERAAREIPAVVHVDGTSRPQVLDEAAGSRNPRYYRLIEEFKKLTGVPVVMNTSFNIKGEPIVSSPHDALRTFFATGLDALAIGNCLVTKTS